MFCPNCGKKVKDSVEICPKCKTKTDRTSVTKSFPDKKDSKESK